MGTRVRIPLGSYLSMESQVKKLETSLDCPPPVGTSLGAGGGKGIIEALSDVSGLELVEKLIRDKLLCDIPQLSEVGKYLLGLGGKRIRPVLVLLCSEAFGTTGPSSEVIQVAAGIELIHMATLLHDDIIDRAETRRHQPSAFVKFGPTATLLAGDFLFSRAFGLCADLDPQIIRWTENSCVLLSEGELLEPLSSNCMTIERCIDIHRRKTGSLFALAAQCSAFLSGKSEVQIESARRFGERLGIAFQMIDDILDVKSSSKTLGKPAGQDLRERKPSLPNVIWLNAKSPLANHIFDSNNGEPSSELVESALAEMTDSGIIAQAQELTVHIASQARIDLEGVVNESKQIERHAGSTRTINPNKAQQKLLRLIDYIVERDW